jgi:hypothetical protein
LADLDAEQRINLPGRSLQHDRVIGRPALRFGKPAAFCPSLDRRDIGVRRHELRLELGERQEMVEVRRGRIAYRLRRGGERVALRHEDHGELHLRHFREIGDAGRGARNDRGRDSRRKLPPALASDRRPALAAIIDKLGAGSHVIHHAARIRSLVFDDLAKNTELIFAKNVELIESAAFPNLLFVTQLIGHMRLERSVRSSILIQNSVAQAARSAFFRGPRQPRKPRLANPNAIIAQVEDSGTASTSI